VGKLILISLLLLISQPLFADWKLVSGNGYVDLDSRRFNGNIVKFWAYEEYPKGFQDGGASVKIQRVIDCYEETQHIVHMISYKEAQLQGDVIQSQDLSKLPWSPIPPNTNTYMLMKMVCTK
jgi:hypothetical protein